MAEELRTKKRADTGKSTGRATTEGAMSGAVKGAAVGSMIPGLGTVAGAGIGAVYGGWQGRKDNAAAEQNPEFHYNMENYQQAGNIHNQVGAAQDYTGTWSGKDGAGQLLGTEQALGIQAFDPAAYAAAQQGALDSQVDKSVRGEVANRTDQAANRGLGQSGTSRALAQEARTSGEQARALGSAQIQDATTQMQLAENARRTDASFRGADALTQNMQFGAQYAQGNRAQDINIAGLQEGARTADNQALYNISMDEFAINEMQPWQDKQAQEEAGKQRRNELYGAGINAAGNIIGGLL